ncbi:S8 family peptidase [Actinophytocola oryzae]|uniref:Subtilase family protein n=1 Tax=Actinophytocola oryzae TaxID=502181 RepID=A0A4R7UU42_9PSEU|nr:S8 family serine peptidase [Actinophytocola oryzae]TDV38699.1 subtilase family protein [Actinophytocola oryzae]
MPLLRRVPAAAVSAVVLATSLVTTGANASATVVDPPRDACSQSGAELRYLVLLTPGTTEAEASADVTAACGALSVYYPEIAVGVAGSADAAFGTLMGTDRAFSAEKVLKANQNRAGKVKGGESVTADPADVDPSDLTGQQWDMTMIGADRARRITPGSRDVLVGVLDSGVDPDHPDLTAALDPAASAGCLTGRPDTSQTAWEPTASSHGTHVAGTIAAADDGHGTTGVAPGVRIASVKVVDDSGYILPEYAVCGLMWATANKMKVTNNSYFVDPWLMTCDRDSEHVVYESVRRAVDYATQHGVLTIAAATNEGADLADPSGRTAGNPASSHRRTLDSSCKVLPAGLRGVVAVSAVGRNELKASYSSYGLGVVDVAAPGGETKQQAYDPSGGKQQDNSCVLSTVPGGYDSLCGTSMATPHVAGVAALLASEHPSATPQTLSKMLTEQAEPLPCPADYDLDGTGAQDAYCTGYEPYNSFYGHGLVNALAAVTP